MSEFETVQEIILKAYRNMSREIWDHVSGGTESETTLLRNRQALDSLGFRPRVLRDVSRVDPSTTLLGKRLRIPVFLAPLGGLSRIHPEGPLLALNGASRFGTLIFLSSVNGSMELEEAAELTKDSLVFQLYIRGDRTWVDAYLERVAGAEIRGFCLTVDIAIYSRRERDLVNRYRPPGRETGEREGFRYQSTMTWDFVDRVRERVAVPLIIKGVATAEDAELAVKHGADVVYVSNHGGRQLDHCFGSMDVLPEVVEAVGGRAEVVIDGGFVRGTDVLKAVALGAKAVGLGKLQAWALAAGGETGLITMLEILEEEISVSMGLLGIRTLDELAPSFVGQVAPVRYPAELSPFPSIEATISKERREGLSLGLRKRDNRR
ncbi:MAG: alpha-hydroxy-acid oxidizing protein [Deltaproteobacteria bacterium]|nr:alpha-hydroxy-acid oxidizing protein [Deltaproteobacteria bacterium]MBW2136492.1 alpha-hydroxy-acid oxidizing protein [Deltaproteobacteria bacterium]